MPAASAFSLWKHPGTALGGLAARSGTSSRSFDLGRCGEGQGRHCGTRAAQWWHGRRLAGRADSGGGAPRPGILTGLSILSPNHSIPSLSGVVLWEQTGYKYVRVF